MPLWCFLRDEAILLLQEEGRGVLGAGLSPKGGSGSWEEHRLLSLCSLPQVIVTLAPSLSILESCYLLIGKVMRLSQISGFHTFFGLFKFLYLSSCWQSNPGPHAYQAGTLPLSSIPTPELVF